LHLILILSADCPYQSADFFVVMKGGVCSSPSSRAVAPLVAASFPPRRRFSDRLIRLIGMASTGLSAWRPSHAVFRQLYSPNSLFGSESKSEQWFANRKLEEKRIFSLQNLEETKTCRTFAIANGTGSGKTEI